MALLRLRATMMIPMTVMVPQMVTRMVLRRRSASELSVSCCC